MNRIGFLLLFFVSLSGCMNAALTGAQAVYKHDYIENKADDEWTRMVVYRAIYHEQKSLFVDSHIVFAAYDNKLLIAGQAPQAIQRSSAEKIARDLARGRKIYNFIEISPATSSLTRLNDHWITTQITSRYMLEKHFPAANINVFTENGTVFLMGSVTVEDAKIAIEIAQKVEGITRIIKMFTLYKRVT